MSDTALATSATPAAVTAAALRRALIAGARRVIAARDELNRINVFPVPDGDTGSNLASTLGSVLHGALSRRSRHAGELLLRVVLPGILGSVLTGTRLAIGMIWVLLVPCEMLGVTSGLGYFILDTRDRLAYSELMAAILLIGMLGYLLDSLARQVQRRWA